MSTIGLDTNSVRPHRMFRWAAIMGGAAIVTAAGLLTAQSFFYTPTNDPKAGAHASPSEPDAAAEPVNFEIVPCPVIETNAQFFFGTGDGSNGYYSERPIHPERSNER